ncbi:DUF6223 family protein [Micromonospora sp. NBC_01638]|uniref:DUF6223 family protein n=1 Tax=Micromonospora sp. NBC_01638 TaxID=2975982 RepID=UPI00386E5099|nr:DUF6223 family protein [Micromonospora sp. NBC_01638]
MPISELLAAPTVDAYTLTGDRVVATAAALVALAGAFIGGLALARSTNGNAKWTSAVALAAGGIGIVAGALVVVTADGGPGTGNGIVGGYAALGLGLTAALLGGIALARTRRIA